MPPNIELMSQKEKDYIAFCFSKNIQAAQSSKCFLDYKAIFEGNKIEFDMQESKKEIKRIFGKQQKRSKKWTRPSLTSEHPFLEDKLTLADFFGVLNILKFIKLEEDYHKFIEDSLFDDFQCNFDRIIVFPRAYDFICEFLEICSEQIRLRMTSLLFQKCLKIQNIDCLGRILHHKLLIDSEMITQELFTSESGYALLISALKYDKDLANKIFKVFLEAEIVYEQNFIDFLKIFYSFLNTAKKQKVKNKIKKSNKVDFNELFENLKLSN